MDAPSLLFLVIVGLAAWFVPRLLVESVGRASDGIAQLFVPPDRSLGWPRGVQEGDDPWGWRSSGVLTAARRAVGSTTPMPIDVDMDPLTSEVFDLGEQADARLTPDGGMIVPVRRVRRH